MHASNAARFGQGFREIADHARIPGRQHPTANVFKLVHDWLRDEKNGKWIVILDNVDDASFLLESQAGGSDGSFAKPLFGYLPLNKNGSILITARSRDAGLKLVEDVVDVDPMDDGQAQALFQTELGSPTDLVDVAELTELGSPTDLVDVAELTKLLEFMPLAIVQAAGYIKKRGQRCSVRDYIEKFQRSDKLKSNLLGRDGERIRRDWEAKNSILVTWHISFEHIYATRQSAAGLLSLMSFFDRQGIPEELINYRSDPERTDKTSAADDNDSQEIEGEENVSDGSADDRFEDDIAMLKDYFFISFTTKATNTFEMYSLVQLATRKWLKDQGRLERWRRQFIRRLCAEFPDGKYENWPKCQRLFPHAKLALLQQPEKEEPFVEWAQIAFNAWTYAYIRGDACYAEDILLKSLKMNEKLLGEENDKTLRCKNMLAYMYSFSGKMKKSKELMQQVLEVHEKLLREEHHSALVSQSNLIDKNEERGCTEAGKEVLGGQYPYIARLINSAAIHGEQWWLNEAKGLEIAVPVSKEMLRKKLIAIIRTMKDLALILRDQEDFKEAAMLEKQVVQVEKNLHGSEHRLTLVSMRKLARAFKEQGQLNDAEKLVKHVLQARKRVLGEEHPETLDTMMDLASIFLRQGLLEKAEELQNQVLCTTRRRLGEEHPQTLTTMSNLAMIYYVSERLEKAEELQRVVLQVGKRVLGEEYPDTALSMHRLALIWQEQGREAEAVDLMKGSIRLKKEVRGADHPFTLHSVFILNKWLNESTTNL